METDRYILTTAMLDGEPDAQIILADLLEEQGDLGLAQWARARKRHVVPRLELAIGLLPFRTALSAACDFAEHAMEGLYWAEFGKNSFPLLRHWVLGSASDAQLVAACKILTTQRAYHRTLAQRKVCHALAAAAQNARLAAHHEMAQSPKAYHFSQQCATEARKTARYARESLPHGAPLTERTSRRSETDWQIAHTRKLLVDLSNGAKTS